MDEPARTYQTDAIAVEWYPERCVHAAQCLAGLPGVFNRSSRPWVQPQGTDAGTLAAVIERCPSGALAYRRLDGGPAEQPAAEATFTPIPNGPIAARGDLRVEDENGRLIREGTRMTLCRCGQSSHKPFCDNTHRATGFVAP